MNLLVRLQNSPRWLKSLLFWTLVAVLSASVVLPFWRHEFLPFMDLPQHIAEASIEAYYDNPRTGFATYYEINQSLHPYYAFRKAQVFLTRFYGPENATKILLSVTAVLLPLSCLLLLLALGRDPRLVLLCFPPVWNYMFFMGYTAYCLSVPLYLIAMALLLWPVPTRLPEIVRVLGVLAAASLSWLMHAETFVFLFASTLVCLPLAFPYRLSVLRALPIGLVVILFLMLDSSLVGDAGKTLQAEYTPLWPKTRAILAIMDVYRDYSDTAVFFLWLAAVLALLVVHPPPFRDAEGRIRLSGLRDMTPVAMLVILFACFWILPFSLLGSRHVVHVAERLLIFYPPFLVLCVGPGRLKSRAAAIVLTVAALMTVFQSVNADFKFAEFNHEAEGFSEVAAQVPINRRVMSIMVTQRSQVVNLLPFMHFGAYVQARRGGLHSFCFATINEIGIRYKAGNPAGSLPENWEWKPGRYFKYDLHGYDWDYFLVFYRDKDNPGEMLVKKKYLKLVAHEGAWFLYQNAGRDLLPKTRPVMDRMLMQERAQAGPPVPGT